MIYLVATNIVKKLTSGAGRCYLYMSGQPWLVDLVLSSEFIGGAALWVSSLCHRLKNRKKISDEGPYAQ